MLMVDGKIGMNGKIMDIVVTRISCSVDGTRKTRVGRGVGGMNRQVICGGRWIKVAVVRIDKLVVRRNARCRTKRIYRRIYSGSRGRE
jgi:hypothetical protein